MIKETAWRWIDDNQNQLNSINDEIWGYAEYGLCEERSSRLLAKTLRKNGFRVQQGVAGMPTAILAEKGQGRPIVAVMGEYDTLPNLSNKPVPRKEPLIEGGWATDAATISMEQPPSRQR